MTDLIMKQQILKRMRYDNPWWTDSKIPTDFSMMRNRLYVDSFYALVKTKKPTRGLILMGPRRVGKTVMLFHTIGRLIADGVSPRKIVYLSIDTPIYNSLSLEELLELACEALVDHDGAMSGYYVFYDEVQYLSNWESHLKSLIDSYRDCKFVASGSAAAALKMKSAESGAGRFTDFMLPPLTFNEYIHLLGLGHLIVPKQIEWEGKRTDGFDTIDIDLLNKHFLNYINYGGYPELVLTEQARDNSSQYIHRDIIDKVLLKDLPSLYGIQDIPELYRLFSHIVYKSGSEFTYETLSKDSGVKKEIIKKYLQYLQAAFLIKVVNRVDENARTYQRATAFKIYLYNPSLRCAFFSPISGDDDMLGNMVETAIYAQWLQRDNSEIYYARWKQSRKYLEVDIVGVDALRQKPYWAVEIKYTDRYIKQPSELDGLFTYMRKNQLKSAVVTTLSESAIKDCDGVTLQFIPSAIYAYWVGHNTVNQRSGHLAH